MKSIMMISLVAMLAGCHYSPSEQVEQVKICHEAGMDSELIKNIAEMVVTINCTNKSDN